jgi:Flp pilus assembly protein TadG
MSMSHRSRLRRLARHHRRGQSIPIIGLMILILVAMVGLSVDVGNTFSEEREAVSASNAAAIAGMSAYIETKANSNLTDEYVYTAIEKSLMSNGIIPGDGTGGTRNVEAFYLDSQGNLLAGHAVIEPEGNNPAPSNVAYVQVRVNGKVDTSFARVVGRNDLPIDANAHAGLCPANSGVYPLAVDISTITEDEFNSNGTSGKAPEWQRLTSGKYAGYIQRRIYVKNGAAGSFSWLRWMEKEGATGQNANSAGELTASMQGFGNISSGFEEAGWPSDLPAPETAYPEQPGTLNTGDWVWGSSGWSTSNSVDAALDEHIANRTMLILPIYNSILGGGSNVQVRVARLGAFVITARGKEAGNGPYFDMIFFGDPVRQYEACSVTPPPPTDTNLALLGNVSFYPEYQLDPTTRQPIQYVVVLDASGSMSANFNGQCNNTGLVQCANGPPGYPAVAVTGTGPTYYWNTEDERRIYVAKKALERLVGLTNMPGNSSYDTSRPDDQMAVVWFRDYVTSSQYMDFSTTPATIRDFIKNANKTGGSSYRSQGGTNGAAGLYQASRLYASAPKSTTLGATEYQYKRVVLYISDGVSNNFLDTNASNLSGGSSNQSTYKNGSTCWKLKEQVVENAECQTTDVGGTHNGWDRPITQMVNTSNSYLRNQSVNAQVFVIALSNIPSNGLKDGVASSSSYFFSAESLIEYPNGTTNVDKIIDEINTKVEVLACQPGADGVDRGTIPSNEFVNGAPGVPFTYPTVGEVIITSDNDTFTAPITAGTGGTLSYRFDNVPRGTYRLEAQLFYHHPLDPPNVMRKYKKLWSGDNSLPELTVDVSASQGGFNSTEKRQDITLRISEDVCAKP